MDAPVVSQLSEEAPERLELEVRESWIEMREQNLLCDAILHTEDGGTFRIHRPIMAAHSQYFKTLFTTSLGDRNRRSFYIPGVSETVMKAIIEYAYAGRIALTEEDVVDLLIGADQLCVLGLLKDCCDFILFRVCFENCISIREFAKTFFLFELENFARSFLTSYFVEISEHSQEFLEMSPPQVLQLLKSDYINAKNEEQVWEAGVRWIDYRPEERSVYVSNIMRCVRLGLLETQYFIEKVKKNKYVESQESCKAIIIETLTFLWDLEMITQKTDVLETPFLATPRIPYSILFAIGGWSGGSPTNMIETYDTKADRWIQVLQTDPAGPRAYHKLAVIGFNIYVIGGFDGEEYFSSCRCFNAVSKEWKEIAPMHAKRCYVSVATLNNLIYAMGGFDGRLRQNTAERYDYHTNQWTCIASMNFPRSDACATTLNGLIYIVGGFNGVECLPSCEIYNPAADTWTLIAPLHHRRSGVSAIHHHGYIYALGGFNGISRLASGEKYDPKTGQWTPVPDMFNPRSNFAIEVMDDMVFVMGGFNGVSTIFHVECFSDHTNEWYAATDMNAFRSALAACVVPGLPDVSDYVHKNRAGLLEEKRQKMIQQKDRERAQMGVGTHHHFVMLPQENDNEDEPEEECTLSLCVV